MRSVVAVLDSRLVIRKVDLTDEDLLVLTNKYTHTNPVWLRNSRLGFSTYGISQEITSWESDDTFLYLPRGVFKDVRLLLAGQGASLEIATRSLGLESQGMSIRAGLRPYQEAVIQKVLQEGGGIFRGPCGSGKTVILLGLIAEIDQPTLVLVHKVVLADQWKFMVSEWLGMIPGSLTGRGKKVIRPVTIGTHKTVSNMLDTGMLDLSNRFGCVIGDEIHRWAAPTFRRVISQFPAAWRIGASADERRKDGLEFLLYEAFGNCVHKIKRKELVDLGNLLPIHMVLMHTGYEDEIYIDIEEANEKQDWQGMITRLTMSEDRNTTLIRMVLDMLAPNASNRGLLLTERVDHCNTLLEMLAEENIVAGRMIGGGMRNQRETAKSIADLNHGRIRVAIGTSVADDALDIPALTHVIPTCPQHTNPKRLAQMIGRTARPYPGKTKGVCLYPWDSYLFPSRFVLPNSNGSFAYGAKDKEGVREARIERFVRTVTKATGSYEII